MSRLAGATLLYLAGVGVLFATAHGFWFLP